MRQTIKRYHAWTRFQCNDCGPPQLISSPRSSIFRFFLAALYLAQSSYHPSCSLALCLLCIAPPPCLHPSVGMPRGSIRSSSLSPAVTLTPRSLRCHTIRLAHVIVSAGAVASRPRWLTAAERAEPDRLSDSTSCSPLINAAGWLVGWHAACHSDHSGMAWLTEALDWICRPARWY